MRAHCGPVNGGATNKMRGAFMNVTPPLYGLDRPWRRAAWAWGPTIAMARPCNCKRVAHSFATRHLSRARQRLLHTTLHAQRACVIVCVLPSEQHAGLSEPWCFPLL